MTDKIERFQDRVIGKIGRRTWLVHGGAILLYFVALGFLVITLGDMPAYQYMGWLVINIPVKLAIFYGFYDYLVPNWLGRKTWTFVGFSLLLLVLYPPLKYGFDSVLSIQSLPTIVVVTEEGDEERYRHWIELARRCGTILGLIPAATLLRIAVDWFDRQRIRLDLERQQLKGELDLLRNQVNPHFLFNVLNSIDSLVYKVSPKGSEAIHKLSAIMRYMLYESNAESVSLQKEVEYLSSYFDLQRMRMKESDQVFFVCNSPITNQQVAPMLFVVFVENAFKHAAIRNGRREITVELEVVDDHIRFMSRNSYDVKGNQEKDDVGGIGLRNVERRLELLYPDRYSLQVTNSNNYYTVYLNLDLTPLEDNR